MVTSPRRHRGAVVVAGLALAACSCGNASTPVTHPSPSALPASPLPAFRPLTQEDAEDVIEHLQAEGLPVVDVVVFDARSDPDHLLGTAHAYVGRAMWRDARLGRQGPVPSIARGGAVEVFADFGDLARRQAEVASAAAGQERDYAVGLVLLRLSAALTPGQAGAYLAALATFPQG